MWTDIRYAFRTLAKSPGFTAVAILTLALGIGANTAIFTVANSLLFRSLPYGDPSRLVAVAMSSNDQRGQLQAMSYARFRALAEQNRSFTGVAAFANESFNLSGSGEAEQVIAARVSWNFFDVLEVHPAIGRAFLESEDQAGAKQVVMISHGLWMRRFGGARDVVGQNITLDARDYTIIGVLPEGFAFALLGPTIELWAPRVFELNITTPQQVQNGAGFLTNVARLRAGIGRDQAQAEMDILDRQYRHDHAGRPDSDPRQALVVRDLQEQLVVNVRPALLILLGAVGFVLLIACANVASLLLSRALGRRKEIAIRAALGASRTALMRQLITESLLLAVCSGIAGILLSWWGTHILSTLTVATLPGVANVRIDLVVLAFTAAISLASGAIFGLAPALELSKPDLNAVLRDEGRGNTGTRSRNYARNLLVVSQVALSMVLLVGSGLLIRSFVRLQTVSLGFDPRNVLTMRIALPRTRYATPQQMIAFYEQVLNEARSLPGVQTAAISSALPLNTSRLSPALPEGQPMVPFGQRPILNIQTISPDYGKTLRVPLLRGREFNEHDDAQAPGVAMVNQALARRFWPNENPIGKHVLLGQRPLPVEVVGVFGDVRNWSIANDANPEVILPFPQLPWRWLNLSVRTPSDPHSLIPALRRVVAKIDKDQPVTAAQTMEELIGSASAQPRLTMLLLGVFSTTALILAIVGIYGVIAYSVAQRTQELGIRIALGAGQGEVLKLVVGRGVGLTLVGVGIGMIGAAALTRVMTSLLYQTSVTDPATFVVSGLLFILVALAASYLPARRATRIDPTEALR